MRKFYEAFAGEGGSGTPEKWQPEKEQYYAAVVIVASGLVERNSNSEDDWIARRAALVVDAIINKVNEKYDESTTSRSTGS